MRITWRAAFVSLGGRQLVALARAIAATRSLPSAPRSAASTRSGRAAKLASPSSAMINGAAHQRGAAQAGQDRAGKPLDGDAAAVDEAGRRAVDRAMAARCRDRSALTLPANDLDRAVCLDPSALSPPLTARASRGSPTRSPRPKSTARDGTMRAPTRGASTRLPKLSDSNCDHWPFPDTNNAGGMWHQCGARPCAGKAGARSGGIARLSTARNCREICGISVLTRRVRPGPTI